MYSRSNWTGKKACCLIQFNALLFVHLIRGTETQANVWLFGWISLLNDECPCSWNNLFEWFWIAALHMYKIELGSIRFYSVLFIVWLSSVQWPMAIQNVNISIWLNMLCACADRIGSFEVAAHMWNFNSTKDRENRWMNEWANEWKSAYYGARFYVWIFGLLISHSFA